jgi:hypothetical protein
MNVQGVSLSTCRVFLFPTLFSCFNAVTRRSPASDHTGTGIKKNAHAGTSPCRNQPGTGIREQSNGLSCWIPECRCWWHRPECRCPAMLKIKRKYINNLFPDTGFYSTLEIFDKHGF